MELTHDELLSNFAANNFNLRHYTKAAKRMKNRALAMAFATWLEEHDKFAVLKRIMKRMLNRRLSGAFLRWAQACEDIQDMRRKLLKVGRYTG